MFLADCRKINAITICSDIIREESSMVFQVALGIFATAFPVVNVIQEVHIQKVPISFGLAEQSTLFTLKKLNE